jgi:hypothetical protein
MRIKVTSLAILHQKKRHGLQKKVRERIKGQKALVLKERESEKSGMPSFKKKLEKGNFSNE